MEASRSVTEYERYSALGSGRSCVALGALHAAYNHYDAPQDIARAAVEAACEFDDGCRHARDWLHCGAELSRACLGTGRMPESLPGGCHCGNVRYVYSAPGTPADWSVRRCTCSFCLRHGARYTASSHAQLEVTVLYASMVDRYTFGTRTAEFLRCSKCGVMILASRDIDRQRYAVLNVNTLDDVERLAFSVADSDFEAEAVADRLQRRQANWIPRVSLQFINA